MDNNITTQTIAEGEDFLRVELLNPYTNKWAIRWTVDGSKLHELIDIYQQKPSLEHIKETITKWHNERIDKQILSGFRWREMPVWLSAENQLNYKATFDLAMQFSGQGGTLPVTFKFGREEEPKYHKFESLEELTDFYLSTVSFVKETLAKGWAEKDAIDWTRYEQALQAYE